MSQKKNIFSAILYKQGDKLIHVIPMDNARYKGFIANLEENQKVEIFLEANKDDATLSQLAKAKVCTRELAIETGNTFEEMEDALKTKAGLCITRTDGEGNTYMKCKSLGDCSKEELGLYIQTIIEVGKLVGMDLS